MSLKGSQTEQNLKDAFAGESQANRRYLYFAAKADVEGFNDVSAVFRSTAEGEIQVTAIGLWFTGKTLSHLVDMPYVIEDDNDDSLVIYFESEYNRDLYLEDPSLHQLWHNK